MESLPDRLEAEGLALAQQTETLVFENYKTFLQLAVNVSRTRRSVHETKVLQGSLLEDVRHLETSCAAFAARASHIAEQRAANRAMMQHYPQILELLEVPRLVESCVKSRSYEKALELLGHCRKSLSQHPVPVLKDIGHNVARSASLMQDQILAQLASDCDMETTIRSVDYLRRLEPESDELRLRQRFLVMREQWMENGKTAVPTSPVSRWLMGLAERLRTDLFYVVTQYQTLFSAGQVPGSANLIWEFSYRKIDEFVQVLKSHMDRLNDGEEIGAVMEQTMYCGSSLSRVGLDFRILTHSIFEGCICKMTRGRLEAALFFFSESLRTHDWRIDPSFEWGPTGTGALEGGEAPLGQNDGINIAEAGGAVESLQPPSSLLKHPPLALLTNDLLDTLNHLRYCAVLSVADQLRALFRSTLSGAVAALQAWGKIPVDSKQAHVFNDMKKEMSDSLIPHIEACIRSVFQAPEKA